MINMKKVNPAAPQPIGLLPRILSLRQSMVAPSVTNQDIANYWKQRRMVEEDHLSAAIKAVARIRVQSLSLNLADSISASTYYCLQDDDYLKFVYSLEDDESNIKVSSKKDENKDVRVEVKDWWTKSIYAYLNEPVMKFEGNNPRGRPSTRLSQTTGTLTVPFFC